MLKLKITVAEYITASTLGCTQVSSKVKVRSYKGSSLIPL